MTLLSQIKVDATNILNDETQGYSELLYIHNTSNEAYGVFLDSWDETDDPRHPVLIIAKTVFVTFDVDHGDICQRAVDSKVYEVFGAKPDPNGTVMLTLRESDEVFA